MKSLDSVAQEIAQQAANPPPKNGQFIKNELSPHFERFTVQVIRNYLILAVKDAHRNALVELAAFRELLPDDLKPQAEWTTSRISEILLSIYK